MTTPNVPNEIVKIAKDLYHIDQFLGSSGSSGSKSTSKPGSKVKSVPWVVTLVAVLVADNFEACVRI